MITHTPDTSEVLSRSCLENPNIKAMANAMCCRRDAGKTSSNDGNLWSTYVCMWWRRSWRQQLVDKPLPDLVEDNEGMQERVFHILFNPLIKKVFLKKWLTMCKGTRSDQMFYVADNWFNDMTSSICM